MLGKLVRRAAPAGQLGTAAGHWAPGSPGHLLATAGQEKQQDAMARGCLPGGAAQGAKKRHGPICSCHGVLSQFLGCGGCVVFGQERRPLTCACLRGRSRWLLVLAGAVCIGQVACLKCPPLAGSRALIGCRKQVAWMTPFWEPLVQFTCSCHTRPRPALSVVSASFSCQHKPSARWLFWAQPVSPSSSPNTAQGLSLFVRV